MVWCENRMAKGESVDIGFIGLGRMGTGMADGDFHKLVQARADIRVWVASLPSAALREKHLQNCKLQIDNFSQGQPGDYYLFVLVDRRSGTTTVEGHSRPPSRPISSVSAPAVLSWPTQTI